MTTTPSAALPESNDPSWSAGSRPVRIGVQIQPQHADYSAIRDAVARAEEIGVDICFNWDHFTQKDCGMSSFAAREVSSADGPSPLRIPAR